MVDAHNRVYPLPDEAAVVQQHWLGNTGISEKAVLSRTQGCLPCTGVREDRDVADNDDVLVYLTHGDNLLQALQVGWLLILLLDSLHYFLSPVKWVMQVGHWRCI